MEAHEDLEKLEVLSLQFSYKEHVKLISIITNSEIGLKLKWDSAVMQEMR